MNETKLVSDAVDSYDGLLEAKLRELKTLGQFAQIDRIEIEQSPPVGIIDRRWIVMKDGRRFGFRMYFQDTKVVFETL